MPKARNGPKGIALFPFFCFFKRAGSRIIVPIMELRARDKRMFFHPRINPQTAVSFISPPPMPPFVNAAISKSKEETQKKPIKLPSQMSYPAKIAYIFHITPTASRKRLIPSGISWVSKSIAAITSKEVDTESETNKNGVSPKVKEHISHNPPFISSTKG